MIPEIILWCFVAVMKIVEITRDRSVNVLYLYIIYSESLSVGLKYLCQTYLGAWTMEIAALIANQHTTVHTSSHMKQIPTQLGRRRDMDRSNLCFPEQGDGIFLGNEKYLPLPSCSPTFISSNKAYCSPRRLSSWKKNQTARDYFSFLLHHQFQPPDPYSLQLLMKFQPF